MSERPSFKAEAEALRDELVAWRRDFHKHPELGFQERRSAAIIAERLIALGYQVKTGLAETGLVATLQGGRPGRVVAARFDMDALPICEENEVDYASANPGVMHACGHDAHMAIGLGLASLAAAHRDELAGALRLIFQPAEEGVRGAQRMLEAGALAAPRPEVFLGCHVWNDRPAGTVQVTAGPVMAATQDWACVIHGRGGHGAQPHQTVDPIVAAAQIVIALQTVVSRNVNPLESAVVTVGMVHGGDAPNIIPSQVKLQGTIRAYSAEVRELLLQRMDRLAQGVAAAYGATAALQFEELTPAVINDARVAEVVRAAAERVVGPERIHTDLRTMGSEDASFYMQEVPGCYIFFGSANPARGLNAPHHNPRFDIDEAVLPLAVAVLMETVARYL